MYILPYFFKNWMYLFFFIENLNFFRFFKEESIELEKEGHKHTGVERRVSAEKVLWWEGGS